MTSKKHQKQFASAKDGCLFCGEKDYRLLDCHRIIPGAEGGTYHPWNTAVVCVGCHRKIHSGLIKVVGRRQSAGKRPWVIEYEEGGETKWR